MNTKYTSAVLGFFILSAAGAHAQIALVDTPATAVSGNVATASDYMFRGLTQTWGSPALQGGADLTMTSGFSAGFWASSVSDKTYPGAALELDLYASYGAQISADWSWRTGLYGYVYPRGNLGAVGLPSRSFNTLEANAAITYRWLTLKYSNALTDYFGIDTEQGYRGDSKNTGYLQLDVTIPFAAEWSLALHAGHTHIGTRLELPYANGADNPDYSDCGATFKYQVSTHWNSSLGATYASNKAFYANSASFRDAADTRNVGGTRVFAMLQATF